MTKWGFSMAAFAFVLVLGCTEAFGPSGEDDGHTPLIDGAGGWDFLRGDVSGMDSGGDNPGADGLGADTLGPDGVQPPVQGPIFRVWITGGASASTDGEVRVIGGIRPGNGVPSGDGVHWVLPVFRGAPVANDS